MRLRPARATDLYLLDGLSDSDDPAFVRDVAAFLALNAWARHQEHPASHFVILEEDVETVGAASFERDAQGVWFIPAICLFPEHRGEELGVATITAVCDLIEMIDQDAQSVYWRRHVRNRPMQRVGEKLGATELGVDGDLVTVALPLH